MALLRDLGITTVAALNELNLAAIFCQRIYLLFQGAIVAHGTPKEVLTPDLIKEIYGVNSRMIVDRETGDLHIIFSP
ncbi:MAG: ABC transporter ATP-binding protein [Desulfobacterium sp.]